MPAVKFKDYFLLTACLLLGCGAVFIALNYQAPGRDEFYQTICVRRYQESPLSLFIYWIGNIWCRIFGFSILNTRILAAILKILSMLAGSAFLYSRTRNIRLTSIIFLLGCIMLRLVNFNIYNWDVGAYLFETISLCLLVSALSKPTRIKYLILGIAIGFVILSRVPSGIFLIFTLILIWIQHDKETLGHRFVPMSLVLGGCVLCIVIFSFIIVGSPWQYANLFFSGHIISGHSPVDDIHRLIGLFAEFMLQLSWRWFFASGCALLALVFSAKYKKPWLYGILILWIIYCGLIAYWNFRTTKSIKIYLGMDSPLGISLLLAVPLYNLFNSKKIGNKTCFLQLWACGLMLFSEAVGSDNFYTRMTSAILLPVISAVLWNLKSIGIRKFVKNLVLFGVLTFGGMFLVRTVYFYRTSNVVAELNIFPMQGIKTDEATLNHYSTTAKALNILRSGNIPYLYIGDHLMPEMLVGPDEGPYFHLFHYVITTNWDDKNRREHYLNKVDAVFYNLNPNDPENIPILQDLKEYGFTKKQTIGNTVILYRAQRKNPDKAYEPIN